MKTPPPPLAPPLQQVDRTLVRVGSRKLIYFGGCDYFRLASHPEVLAAVRETLTTAGLNVAASRKTTGNHRLYGMLERELARFFRADGAVLVGAGYLAPWAAAQALAGEVTHLLLDERAHGCLLDAARWLSCPRRTFVHRDPASLRRALARLGPAARPLVMTDGLFSHNGSIAPLREYLDALPARGWLMVDDAHAAGVLGPHGRGTAEHCGVRDPRLIQAITLSKAFGAYGGAVVGIHAIVEAVIAKSGVFVGNTPTPLPLAAAALASLRLLRRNPAWRTRLLANADHVKSALRAAGMSVPNHPGPMIPILPRDDADAARLRRALSARGIHPPFVRYPGGPATGYFRFAISSEHTPTQLDALVAALIDAAGPPSPRRR